MLYLFIAFSCFTVLIGVLTIMNCRRYVLKFQGQKLGKDFVKGFRLRAFGGILAEFLLVALALIIRLLLSSGGESTVSQKDYLTELPAVTDGEYPETFDLRDYGYVTSVKNQGELGCCWAFGSCAAAESSILSELKTNINDNDLNLSEHHLLWFSKSHIPAEGEEGYDENESQAGEGFYSDNPVNSSWNSSSDTYAAILTFASGTGAASEETAPYQDKNGKVSADGDWSLDESVRYSRLYDLEAGYMLPMLKAVGDELNTEGIDAVKEMLLQGKAVAIAYAYDDGSEAASSSGTSPYLNEKTWAHYAYEEAATNHAVTIVGWDDHYSKENFNKDHQPAGDGAWIVKNSWGAKTEKKPNKGDWGVDGSGCFYLSYYDQTVDMPAAYDFDTTVSGSAYSVVQQYDLMNVYGLPRESSDEAREANVFTAEQDMELQAVGFLCAASDTDVTIEVYLLDGESDDLTGGTAAASLEKEYQYAGYYRETLKEPVTLSAGQKYAVVVTQQQKDGGVYYYQYGEALQGKDSLMAMFTNAWYEGVINQGESFLYTEDKGWQDLKDYLKAEDVDEDSVADDNFCIKAFGN